MNLKNLNGWQRLWVLISAIYLIVIVLIAVVDFPSPGKIYISDDDITKNLSAKTLDIRSKGDNSSPKWNVDLNNGYKVNVPVNTTEADIDYICKDYNNSIHSITEYKQMFLLVKMVFIWLVPCMSVYTLGLSLCWVYKGFKK